MLTEHAEKAANTASRNNWFRPFAVNELSGMTGRLENITQEWNTMLACRDKLLSGGKHARALFVISEG